MRCSRPIAQIQIFSLGLVAAWASVFALAQTPVVLPYTMTTIAGGLAPQSSYTAGAACPGASATTASSAYGDNCAAVSGLIGAGSRAGVQVDQYGNVIVGDDINKMIHLIDANSGQMTVLAGGNTVCDTSAGVQDKMGDGCLAATQTANIGTRGFGLDAYGNVLIANYSYNAIHLVCRYASPLCTANTPAPTTANPIQVQIGYMGIVGGCLASASTSNSPAFGIGLDGSPAFSTSNTNNTASYPAQLSGSDSDFKNGGTCTTSLGEVWAPRAAWGDIYGNIYYADTNTSRTRVILGPKNSSYFLNDNPLHAALMVNTGWTIGNLKPGYVYTIVNVQGYSTATTTANVTVGGTCLATLKDHSTSITYAYTGSTPTALDTHSDGCPFFDSSVYASAGATVTAVTDAAGNLIFTEPYNSTAGGGLLRVFLVQGWATTSAAAAAGATGSVAAAGVAMYNAILKNNPTITPTVGYIYALAGGANSGMSETTTASLSTAPTLGNATTFTLNTITKLAISPQGNIYIGASDKVLFYDIYNGTIRILLSTASSSTSTKGGYCTGSSGAIAKDTLFDGCPASLAYWGATNTQASFNLPVAVDGQGNLYMVDSDSSTYSLVRKVLAQGTGTQSNLTLNALMSSNSTSYPLQALGATQTQTYWVHFPYAAASGASVTNSTNANFAYGTPSCTWYDHSLNSLYDNSMDCYVTVTYTPTAVGQQSAQMTVTETSGGESITINLGGTVAGSALAIDNATSGGSRVTPTTSALFNGSTPYAVATDNAGNIYAGVASGSNYSIVESLAGSTSSLVTLASGLTARPTAIAVDQAGNIFYLLSGTSTIQELALASAQSTNNYISNTLTYYPPVPLTANPTALTTDAAGNLYVADNQSSVSTIYKISPSAVTSKTAATCSLAYTAGAIQPSLCQSPVYNVGAFGVVSALSVDAYGNLYVADTTNSAVYKLTPQISSGIYTYGKTTAASSVMAKGVATDAAGDLYVLSSSGVNLYPQSGSSTVSIASTVLSPAGLAVDGAGAVYVADSGYTYMTQLVRDALTVDFGSNSSLALDAILTNTGNQVSAAASSGLGSIGDFTVDSSGGNGCVFSNRVLQAMNAGQACAMTASYPTFGIANTTYSGNILFGATSPAASALGTLTLTGKSTEEGYDTTTTIAQDPSSTLKYSSSTAEVTYNITVTANSSSLDGTITNNQSGPTTSDYVAVAIDGGSAANDYVTSTSGLHAYLSASLSGLAVGTHTVRVTFPQQGAFAASSASTSVTIVQGTPTLTISAPASAVYGGSYSPTIVYTGDGTVSLSGTTGVCTVAGSGTSYSVSFVGVGNCTLTASATAGTNYAAITGSAQSFAISQARPTVSAWPTASSITYGQTLASSTLTGGTATVAGSFAWTTPSTVPAEGTASYGVTFTPVTAANYAAVTGTVSLTVKSATIFTMETSSSGTATVVPGSAASYSFTVTPGSGSFSNVVNFSVSGLPAAATATFSPSSISAGSGTTPVTLKIQTASTSARNDSQELFRKSAPLALALLLPLFSAKRMRKQARCWLALLLVLAGLAVTTALTGCGGNYFSQAAKSYTIIVTATSGNTSQSTSLTLNVE